MLMIRRVSGTAPYFELVISDVTSETDYISKKGVV